MAIYQEFLTLRLSKEQLGKLKAEAAKREVFVSDVLRSLIETALESE